MKISILTPPQPEFWTGNRVTSERWAGILRQLDHEVSISTARPDAKCDMLVALHSAKSAETVERFAKVYPQRPIVVALTGTDVYGDRFDEPQVVRALEAARRIIMLQPVAAERLPKRLTARARVIYQSTEPPSEPAKANDEIFEICVIGNLREEKDPFRTADAARLLPRTSRIHVVHIGGAIDPEIQRRAEKETEDNPRYEWLGAFSRNRTMARLAGARVMSLTSRMEGGANVVSEAAVCGVPVIASRIPGTVGLLGEDYPGYFEVGDTKGLAKQLRRVETDVEYHAALQSRIKEVAPLFSPEKEMAAWEALLKEL